MSIIAVGDTAVLPLGTVERAARGTVRMESPAGISEIVDPALDDADDLVIMTFPGWLVAVGERSQRVLTCEISRPRLRIMGQSVDLSSPDMTQAVFTAYVSSPWMMTNV